MSHQAGEGGHDHDEGHADAHAGEGQSALTGDVSDVDPVHDVVEHVDDLRAHGGQGQAQQKGAHRLRSEKCLAVVHGDITSFPLIPPPPRERRWQTVSDSVPGTCGARRG